MDQNNFHILPKIKGHSKITINTNDKYEYKVIYI